MFRLKNSKNLLLWMLYLLILVSTESMALPIRNSIDNYVVYLGVGQYNKKAIVIIRKFEREGQINYVAIDPDNLKTFILLSKDISVKPVTWNQLITDYRKTAYIKAVLAARKQSSALQNSGIIHGSPKIKGVTLTVDLCPSRKPMDRVIFTSLIAEFNKTERPVPVAISITGRFMAAHKDDFNWLMKLVKSGDISITWVNHTFSHRFNPKAPLKRNFLLEPNTDLNFEILETEKALLQQQVIFSIFFRFPGLVSNHEVVDKVTEYGLIPIGSDAWLAKGQPVHEGSILLIHGNGNEPLGVRDFISLLKTEKSSVMKKQWLMYDLRESIESEFQN